MYPEYYYELKNIILGGLMSGNKMGEIFLSCYLFGYSEEDLNNCIKELEEEKRIVYYDSNYYLISDIN